MTPLDLELVPRGEPDAPRHPLRSRICHECAEDLAVTDHGPRCTERAGIYRLNVTNDPELRRAEDELERANMRAFNAWLRSSRGCP